MRPVVAFSLTQAEVEQAVWNALTSAPLNFSGGQINTVPWLYPSFTGSAQTIGEFLLYNLKAPGEESKGTIFTNTYQSRLNLEALLGAVSNGLSSVSAYHASISNSLNQIAAALQSTDFYYDVVSNALLAIRERLDDNFDIPLSDIDAKVESTYYQLQSMSYDLLDCSSSIRSILESDLIDDVSYIASNLNSDVLIAITNQLEFASDKLEDIYSELPDIGQILTEIQADTAATATDVHGILNYLWQNIDEILTEAFATAILTIPTPLPVTVTNFYEVIDVLEMIGDVVTNDLHGIDSLLRGMSPVVSDIDYFTRYGMTNLVDRTAIWYDASTNFYASMIPSAGQVVEMVTLTNTIATNYVAQDEEYEEMAQSFTNAIRRDDVELELTDYLSENPYDVGLGAFDTIQGKINSVFGGVNPSTTSDLVIMGSSGTSSSLIRVPLPRITVNLEYFFGRFAALRTIRGMMAGLWVVVGVVYKLILVSRFLSWFSQHKKE